MTSADDTGKSDESDEAAFAQAMQDVVPLSKATNVDNNSRNTGPQEITATHLARRRAATEESKPESEHMLTLAEVPQVQPLEYLEWRKDGIQLAVFDKLRHAGYPIGGHLDLHRKTVKEARDMVIEFIQLALKKQWRCVLMSPGKGEHSPTPARLKSFLAAWLVAHPYVNAYCSAQRQHGGVGAVYVLLKKSVEASENNRDAHEKA